MVDTLVQQDNIDGPQSMAQSSYRVETKSEIKPYVVRDHSWSLNQHDDMNEAEYQADAPEGYTERMDYGEQGYNKPLDKSAKAASTVQETAPGDKNAAVV